MFIKKCSFLSSSSRKKPQLFSKRYCVILIQQILVGISTNIKAIMGRRLQAASAES